MDGCKFVCTSITNQKKNMSPLLFLSFRVAVISHIPAGRSLTITFTRLVEGRYVTVVLPGANRILQLCEVEVYGYRAPTGEYHTDTSISMCNYRSEFES